MKQIRQISYMILVLFLFSCGGGNTSIENKHTKKNASLLIEEYLNKDNVLVVAHRGDWRNAPENSLQAIKNCIKMGVDIVEIDVRMTKDSILVLMHDGKIDRTTTGTGFISELTLSELKNLNLKNGANHSTHHKIPTLEEAMQLVRGKILINLDKCSGYMNLAYRVLDKTNTRNQVIFKGSKAYSEVREQYGSLLDSMIYMPIIEERTPELTEFVAEFEKELQPVAYEVIYTSNNSPMFPIINNLKERGSGIWVNTLWSSLCGDHYDDLGVDNPDLAWGWVIDHGANIIQTDRPALLLKYLREKDLHN